MSAISPQSPWQWHIHGEHVHPELNLALLDARLVRIVQSSSLNVFRHQLAANLIQQTESRAANFAFTVHPCESLNDQNNTDLPTLGISCQ